MQKYPAMKIFASVFRVVSFATLDWKIHSKLCEDENFSWFTLCIAIGGKRRKFWVFPLHVSFQYVCKFKQNFSNFRDGRKRIILMMKGSKKGSKFKDGITGNDMRSVYICVPTSLSDFYCETSLLRKLFPKFIMQSFCAL